MSTWCRVAVSLVASMAMSYAASIEGRVLDSRGRPVAGVVVLLNPGDHELKTDSTGRFRFTALPAARYNLRSEVPGQGVATSGPFALAADDEKRVDLTFAPSKPEFFDQPTFIVAGVTDSTSRGGHGSDAVLRSSEALAKETASLGTAEKGDPLEAVRKYQRLAELDASEQNLFDWGAELLAHRAYEPAIEVFTRANRSFPRSARILLGLAVAFYANASYDEAAKRFFEATDINPRDPGPYLFLANTQASSIADSDAYRERMRRFAKLQPDNAWANYYYAVSLARDKDHAAEAEQLLEKALELDPKLAPAHLEIGIIDAGQGDVRLAIDAYQKALAINPRLEEAHYRLAQAYARSGEKEKAQAEFALHDKLAKESAAAAERERRQIQQFVIELRKPVQ